MNACIQTPVANLESTLNWYRAAKFVESTHNETTYFTDGAVLIRVNPAPTARPGIVLFGQDDSKAPLTASPSGVWVYREPTAAPSQPPADNSLFGTCKGVSIEAMDPVAEASFWSGLGFELRAGDPENGWASYSGHGMGLSIMGPNFCPHLFYNPGLTFFNSGQNLEVIANLREAGIELTQELTCFNDNGEVDNAVVRDPAGLGFFVFND